MVEASKDSIMKMPVTALLSRKGIIARDIVSRDGSFIVPAGVDIGIFDTAIKPMVKKMLDSGIKCVYIRRDPVELTDAQIDGIIDRVYSNDNKIISKEKIAHVVKSVNSLFKTFKAEDYRAGAVGQIENISTDLAYEIIQNPAVAFSLCKVHDTDEYTFIHSFNVAVMMGCLANSLHPNDHEYVKRVVTGGLMHDVGKSQIPLDILNKPKNLTDDEFNVMMRHSMLGVALAQRSGLHDTDVLDMIRSHHEKWGGDGYPYGLSGRNIPEPARIAAVADVFDALTAKRCYKDSMTGRDAISAILGDAGVHFDAKIGHALLTTIGLYPPGSLVLLSDGRHGVVVSSGGENIMRPTIKLRDDWEDKESSTKPPELIDLRTAPDISIVSCYGQIGKRAIGLPVPDCPVCEDHCHIPL